MQQDTDCAHSRQTFPPLFALSVSLCAKIAPSAGVTDQTQSPGNLAVTQSGMYFQNCENSQKIKEITYDYNFFQKCDQEQI